MTHVSISELTPEVEQGDRHYLEVLSTEAMRVELAHYPNPEPTHPHDVDELYVIQTGAGTVRVGTDTYAVEAGDVVYVEQGLAHEFIEIDDDITALIIFPAATPASPLDDE